MASAEDHSGDQSAREVAASPETADRAETPGAELTPDDHVGHRNGQLPRDHRPLAADRDREAAERDQIAERRDSEARLRDERAIARDRRAEKAERAVDPINLHTAPRAVLV